jgi:hypothetical protein
MTVQVAELNWTANWTRSAIFSASLAELNSQLTAHLELPNLTNLTVFIIVITVRTLEFNMHSGVTEI